MGYTVTGLRAGHAVAFRHASALPALDHGMSLVAAGVSDVRICDGGGRPRTPADLYGEMFGARPPERARRDAVALAA